MTGKNTIINPSKGRYGLVGTGDLPSLILNKILLANVYYKIFPEVTGTPLTGVKNGLVRYMESTEATPNLYVHLYSADGQFYSRLYNGDSKSWEGWKSVSSGGGGGIVAESDPIYTSERNSLASKVYVDDAIADAISGVTVTGTITYRGNVATFADLPTNATLGDYYQVDDTGYFYLYDGTQFKLTSGLTDLTDYYTETQVDQLLNNLQTQITQTNQALNTERIDRSTVDADILNQIDALDSAVDDLNNNAVAEAPKDGKTYGRNGGAWVEVIGGSGGIEEAPIDGTPYIRQDGAWISLNNILANYVQGGIS